MVVSGSVSIMSFASHPTSGSCGFLSETTEGITGAFRPWMMEIGPGLSGPNTTAAVLVVPRSMPKTQADVFSATSPEPYTAGGRGTSHAGKVRGANGDKSDQMTSARMSIARAIFAEER